MDHLSVQQNFPLPVIADAGDLQDNTEGKITKTCDLETPEAGPEAQRALSWTCQRVDAALLKPGRFAQSRTPKKDRAFALIKYHSNTASAP